MPRYHFNVFDGKDALDAIGTELPDLAAAKREAVQYSGALLREATSDVWDGRAWRMVVTDHMGISLFALLFLGMDTAPHSSFVPLTSND